MVGTIELVSDPKHDTVVYVQTLDKMSMTLYELDNKEKFEIPLHSVVSVDGNKLVYGKIMMGRGELPLIIGEPYISYGIVR